jgi:hypothetical protein
VKHVARFRWEKAPSGGSLTMDVIGAGYGRTGTLSLHSALIKLGFGPCHHMREVFVNLEQMHLWREALAKDPVDVRRVYGGYRATVDFPGCVYWRELLAAWPDAKVILTTRDPHSWYASIRDTIFAVIQEPILPDVTDPETVDFRHFMFEELVPRFLDIGGGRRLDQVGEDEAIEAFNRHIAEVRSGVPAEQLLVYQVSDGWGPLCDFLDVPVPDEEFPHLNESANFENTIARFRAERARKLAERRARG